MNRTLTYTIPEESAGLRVEQFLKRKGYSRQNITEIKRMPKSVILNGLHVYLRDPIAAGDYLEIRICENDSSEKIPPVKLPLDIVYEDEDIIVINKPAGMPIHPSMQNYTNSMANALAWYYKEQGKPFIFRCSNRLRPRHVRTYGGCKASGQREHSLLHGFPQGSSPGIPRHRIRTHHA